MDDRNLTTVEGQIINVNTASRGIAIRDKDGITDGFPWDPSQDREFMRLKVGWYAKITLEKRGDKWIAISQAKAPRPAGSRKEDPDQRMIMKSVLIKTYTDLWMQTVTPGTITFDDARKDIRQAVDEDLPWAMGEAGSGA